MRRGRAARRGQALVEFAMIVPMLLTMIFGIVEFALITTTLSFCRNAAYEAARGVALAGPAQGDIDARTVKAILSQTQGFFTVKVTEIEIYQVGANGAVSQENAFDGTGAAITPQSWPVSARSGTATTPLVVGVRITFVYQWLTSFIAATGTHLTLTASATAASLPVG